MGLFSSKKTTTNVDQRTFTQNTNVQGVGGPAIVGDNNAMVVSYEQVDYGAVQGAFDLLDRTTEEQQRTNREALDAMRDVSGSALSVSESLASDAFDLSGGLASDALDLSASAVEAVQSANERALTESLRFAQRAGESALDWAGEAVRSEVAQGFDTLIKWTAGAAAVVALGFALRGALNG